MAQFCQQGDTARVTFPNGSTQDFIDTPISVECKIRCQAIQRLDSAYEDPPTSGNPNGRTIFRTDFGNEVRLRRSASGTQLFRDTTDCNTGATVSGLVGSSSVVGYFNLREISRTIASSGGGWHQITITGFSGISLFSGNFDNCNYSVECIGGCPPNTLDCGDCCLLCDTIFNQISALRSQLARLR